MRYIVAIAMVVSLAFAQVIEYNIVLMHQGKVLNSYTGIETDDPEKFFTKTGAVRFIDSTGKIVIWTGDTVIESNKAVVKW